MFLFFSFKRISYQVKGGLCELFCFNYHNARLIKNNKTKKGQILLFMMDEYCFQTALLTRAEGRAILTGKACAFPTAMVVFKQRDAIELEISN